MKNRSDYDYERKMLMDEFDLLFIKYKELVDQVKELEIARPNDKELLLTLYEQAFKAQKCIKHILEDY